MDTPVAECLITLRDGSGSPGRVTVYAPSSLSIETVRPALAALAGQLALVTGCVVTGLSVTYRAFFLPAGPPVAGAVVARKLVLVFDAGPGAYAVLKVPGLTDASLDAGGQVDVAGEVLVELVAAVAAGIWTNPFGDDIASLVAAYEEFDPV